ncbi:uncharacterized, partial [Tachysurus ichikawai]
VVRDEWEQAQVLNSNYNQLWRNRSPLGSHRSFQNEFLPPERELGVGSDRTGQMRTHSVGYGGSGEVWEQGASGGSSDDASGSACARMKRRRLRVQSWSRFWLCPWSILSWSSILVQFLALPLVSFVLVLNTGPGSGSAPGLFCLGPQYWSRFWLCPWSLLSWSSILVQFLALPLVSSVLVLNTGTVSGSVPGLFCLGA